MEFPSSDSDIEVVFASASITSVSAKVDTAVLVEPFIPVFDDFMSDTLIIRIERNDLH